MAAVIWYYNGKPSQPFNYFLYILFFSWKNCIFILCLYENFI